MQDNSVRCFEWAPGAEALSLVGNFSMFSKLSMLPLVFIVKFRNFLSDSWNTESHPYKKLEYGKWELIIPAKEDGSCPIPHNSIVKVNNLVLLVTVTCNL